MPAPADDVLEHVSNNVAIYALALGLLTNFGIGVWFFASEDARLGAAERWQTAATITIDRLNDAREKVDIHLTQVDDKLANMDGKISAILDIVQRMEDGASAPKGRPGGQPYGAPR